MKSRRALSVALVLGAILLTSLLLMSGALQNAERFGELFGALVVVNALGLLTLAAMIVLNVRRLVLELRRGAPGARLKLRMVGLFALLSVVPVTVVYGFSLDFLRRGIDSWFDVRIDQAMQDALKLSQTALDLRMLELLRQTEQMAEELTEPAELSASPLDFDDLAGAPATIVINSLELADSHLDALRRRSGAEELSLLTRKGSAVKFSSSTGDLVPSLPPQSVLLQVRQGQSYIGLDPISDQGLYVRVAVNVPNIGLASEARVLQALFPVAPRMNTLADSVESIFAQYRELSFLRSQLKVGFTMTLTLVLAASVLGALWAAFYSAARLAAPVRDLAEATRAVADGRYETWVPPASKDDLGFLVQSFNAMTRSIRQARDEARRSRDQVDAERAYLEAVLSRLSSGVLTLDTRGTLRTINPSATRILGAALPAGEPTLGRLGEQQPHLQPLCDRLLYRLRGSQGEWQEEITLFGAAGRQVLMCRGKALPPGDEQHGEHVVVFDDVTTLIQAQKNAAWSEVARRLAHEIKNPLTPIQLSAERLRHKYLRQMEAGDAEVLDRLTRTIVQQVETLKQMVNTFSEYARAPRLQPVELDIGNLVEEVLELFRSLDGAAQLQTDIDPDLPVVQADAGRLRRVLNNLVKNAIEAAGTQSPPRVRIAVHALNEAGSPLVEIRVSDNGNGISPDMLPNVFEPYVTSKPRGTGLGLAIVRKIVEEHGGMVTMENLPEGGACVVLRLPTVPPAPAAGELQRSAV